MTETGDIRIAVGAETSGTVGAQLDPIHLSIFSHRFMSIAGECAVPLSSRPSSPWVGGGGVCQPGTGSAGSVAGEGAEAGSWL